MTGALLKKVDAWFSHRFLVACWSPFCMVALITMGLFLGLCGDLSTFGRWFTARSSTEQILLGAGALLLTIVVAYVLETLTIPLFHLYQGAWVNGNLARWSCQRQRLRMAKSPHLAHNHFFPKQTEHIKPTRLGNMLAATEEYVQQLYQLDTNIWLPHLLAVLPEAFRTQIDTALTPVLAMFNSSFLLTLLAMEGILIGIFFPAHWVVALLVLCFGCLLARIAYKTAIRQMIVYNNVIRVAFDLYRQDILTHMHIPLPDNLFAEQRLWQVLNAWMSTRQPPWDAHHAPPVSPPDDPFYNDRH
jgi:hypothetical protein